MKRFDYTEYAKSVIPSIEAMEKGRVHLELTHRNTLQVIFLKFVAYIVKLGTAVSILFC